ncbi:site-specific integrase [Lentzea tibetensis]|uniref:Site-specific integrase n=1 Tax=Lentzea tibetensis TaxID=2591470 RepID=A0A563F0A2_9PSEU|nr:site-specific integrase [Lentzea tibetensis]TWP53208.1 site-specific integrase [Lentzea tibetensis]
MGHVQDRWFRKVPDPSKPGKHLLEPTARNGVGKRYRARVIGPDGGEISESFADGQDKAAQNWVDTTEAKITLGIYVPPKAAKARAVVFLEPFGKTYLEDLDVDEASREIMEMRFRKHIFPHLGQEEIPEIKASHLRSWDSKLRKADLSDQYRHTLFMNLLAALNAAVDDGLIDKNPCEGKSVKKPKPTKKKIIPWPEARIWSVRSHLPDRFQVLTDLGAGLGLRQGECLGLGVEDLAPDRGKVTVCRQIKTVRNQLVFALPKYEKERDVPLGDHVLAAIKDHMELFPPVKVTLPWGKPGGKLVTASLIVTSVRGLAVRANDFDRNYWKKALKAAGVPCGRYENGMHDLRHFFASVLLDQGESIKAVAEWLGHADPAFTLGTYTHLMPSSDSRTRGVIDGLYSRRNGPETAHEDPTA